MKYSPLDDTSSADLQGALHFPAPLLLFRETMQHMH
jgi:hypothetical protein